MKRLLYFGCMRGKGHFLFDNSILYSHSIESVARSLPGVNPSVLKYMDDTYVPYYKPEGLYNLCIVPPLIIIAWNDYSMDSRPGSNSNLIAYGYEMKGNYAEEIIDDAYKIYPLVMNRQKARPTRFLFPNPTQP